MPRQIEPKNSDLAELIQSVAQSDRVQWEKRFEDIQNDLNNKHKENVDRRHKLGGDIERVDNDVHNLTGRVAVLESKLTLIVGDNTGGSGLLNQIDKKQDAFQSDLATVKQDIASIKQTVQDTPSMRKWVYGAMAVLAFLAIVIPMVTAILLLIYRH